MHRIIFCGDRNWVDEQAISFVIGQLKQHLGKFIMIEGEARGADVISWRMANHHGIKVKEYPADWDKYHKAAGPIRNRQMVKEGKATAVIAFHANISESKGTKDMVAFAQKQNLPVYVYVTKPTGLQTFIKGLLKKG